MTESRNTGNQSNTEFELELSKEVWENNYKYHEDENVDDTFYRIAKAIASAEDSEELQLKYTDEFYSILQGWASIPGGRIIANAGTSFSGVTLANCYVNPKILKDVDSIEGIYEILKQQALTLKSEGGWGFNFSVFRPRTAQIRGVGIDSPGALSFMDLFDVSSGIITSGSGVESTNDKGKKRARKGALMGVMDCWHPDIEQFIIAKQQPGRLNKFNVSVNATEDFMQKVSRVAEIDKELERDDLTDDEKNALKSERESVDKWDLVFPDTTHEDYEDEWDGNLNRWMTTLGNPIKVYKTISASEMFDLITTSTYNRAEPGLLFLDTANRLSPSGYHESEYVQSTNPSMPAGTRVHTNHGFIPIKRLEGTEFKVKSMDGIWANAKCRKSGESEDLIHINFGGQRIVSSTKEHRWPVWDARQQRIYKMDAKDLKVGDMIPKNLNELSGISGDMSFTEDEGFLMGILIGDGWLTARSDGSHTGGITFPSTHLSVAERCLKILNSLKRSPSTITKKKDADEYYIQFTSDSFFEDYLVGRWGVDLDDVKRIPAALWESNDGAVIGFVDGILSSDGYVAKVTSKDKRIIFTSANQKFAEEFSQLLSFYGINGAINTSTTKNIKFPDGKVCDKEYTRHDWNISMSNILLFNNIFKISDPDKSRKLTELVDYINETNTRMPSHFNHIKSIEEDTSGQPVWDISVEHNEHVFPVSYGYTGNCGEQLLPGGSACVLSSMNLTQFIDFDLKDFDYENLIHSVKILTRFLDNVNTVTKAPLPEYKYSMTHKRRIGLGITGWGSSLYMLKIKFGSEESLKLQEKVMQTISRSAYEASIDLAVEKGMYSYCDPIKHSEGEFIQRLNLSDEYMQKLRTTGIRNSAITSIQPTGSSSVFAQNVSSGCEPVFMHEYVRTMIMDKMPTELEDVCPKWYEGEWHETEVFKNAFEGTDPILIGKGPVSGHTYKIDKNRGLTRENVVDDYGVRFMKEKNEWNADADWAVTTRNLTVQNHIDSFSIFCKFCDSAVSKTINVPKDYPYEDFKNVYMDTWKTGYAKGCTTYRDGSLMSVLSEVKETEETEEEIILDNIKLPESSRAEVKTLRAEGRKLYLTITFFEDTDRPFALFVKSNYSETSLVADEAVDLLHQLAIDKGIPSNHINDQIQKMRSDNNINKVARLISLNLRHGVLIKNIVAVLDKSEMAVIGSFTHAIKKFLSNYIKDGELVGDDKTCNDCGGQLKYESGCFTCMDCSKGACN